MPNSGTGSSLELTETEDLVALVTLEVGLALQSQWQSELDYSFAQEYGLSCAEWAVAIVQKTNVQIYSKLFSIFIPFSISVL